MVSFFTALNLLKAVQMKPKFEVHALFIYEQMEMDLNQFKRKKKLGADFYKQLQQFFVRYLKVSEQMNFMHGDIKPRTTLETSN